MDKIKVSKEVAAALDLGIKVAGKERLLTDHFSCMTWKLKEYEPLNQISNWKMAQILINGYEVELTKEEKILDLYKEYEKSSSDGIPEIIIENVLKILEIKIKGIND